MHLNKVNLCWVISDGRKGHEIQSLSLANRISDNAAVYRFQLKQPWKLFTPRTLPRFDLSIIWQGSQGPRIENSPNCIITTGRKAAAVGKYLKQKLMAVSKPVHHLQILDPKDAFKNYDLLFIPNHDQVMGENVINFTGSIHPFDQNWFQDEPQQPAFDHQLSVILGNPPKNYFSESFGKEIQQIRTLYPNQSLMFCGSPRLNQEQHLLIKSYLNAGDQFWLNKNDGENPYLQILKNSQHIFVTADSINMINECAASSAQLTLLAKKFITSNKHQRFISEIAHRLNGFYSINKSTNLNLKYPVDEIIKNNKLQKLLNSPNSSSSG